MIRVLQYWTKHPETGERVDVSYMLQTRFGDDWVDVPIVQVELISEEKTDEEAG